MDKATPESPIQVTLLKPVVWMESGIAGDWHIMVKYADDAPFEYAALFYRYGYTDNATIHRAATEIAISIGATEPVEERHRHLNAEVQRVAAQAAPTDNELGKRTTSAATARSHEIPNGSESANQVNPADQRGAPEPVANGGDARGASGGCARPTACTHPACQCVAQSAPFKREDLTLAAVNCEHQIDADCVRLWRDETKEGTALSQLVDRVAAVVAQSVPDLDTMRADFHQWCATNGYKTGFVNGGECPMGRPVYEDHRTHAAWWAFQKAAKLYGAQSAQPDAGEVRMLTKVEVVEVVRTTDPGIALLNALQRAFCKANAGKRIPVDGEVRS